MNRHPARTACEAVHDLANYCPADVDDLAQTLAGLGAFDDRAVLGAVNATLVHLRDETPRIPGVTPGLAAAVGAALEAARTALCDVWNHVIAAADAVAEEAAR